MYPETVDAASAITYMRGVVNMVQFIDSLSSDVRSTLESILICTRAVPGNSEVRLRDYSPSLPLPLLTQ